jgi:hypothetical protein
MADTVSIPADVAHAFTDAWCTTVIRGRYVSL